jgi:hypothetical protein
MTHLGPVPLHTTQPRCTEYLDLSITGINILRFFCYLYSLQLLLFLSLSFVDLYDSLQIFLRGLQ